jgi:hypothetical protein
MPRRHFGSVRKLPSGRYQASYWHLAERHTAPTTFTTKADAQAWLSNIETNIHQGDWVDPAGGRLTVAELAARWKERDPSKRSSTLDRDEGHPSDPCPASVGCPLRLSRDAGGHAATGQRLDPASGAPDCGSAVCSRPGPVRLRRESPLAVQDAL